ncbi:hypothetical protein KY345_01805 [Candidatus Woesearchaeota archaeon]|nr:hypothetical protein [Candidatus Woesearchaeota archaeon]
MRKLCFAILIIVSLIISGCAEEVNVKEQADEEEELKQLIEELGEDPSKYGLEAEEEAEAEAEPADVAEEEESLDSKENALMAELKGMGRGWIVYKEFKKLMRGNEDWRITDPYAKPEKARSHLPNPILNLLINDLSDANKAELIIDRWGGHAGTSNKRIRFNWNSWIRVQEPTTMPAGHSPECYMYEDNPTVNIPLGNLKEGANSFEGTSDGQICYNFDWGQWGWFGVILRVHYYHDKKPHPYGRIISPVSGETMNENPVIKAEAVSEAGIERIDFIGYYEDYDIDGDGVYTEWQEGYFSPRDTDDIDIGWHIGTVTEEPYEIEWDTEWIPDQPRGSIKIKARIKDKNGVWTETPVVGDLSLSREKYSVKLYKASNVPEKFNVRAGETKECTVNIPDLLTALKAKLHLRTWNGDDANHKEKPLKVNNWESPVGGKNHNYYYSIIDVPLSALKEGDNTVSFNSPTEHHGIEVLWPGPAITVRYLK